MLIRLLHTGQPEPGTCHHRRWIDPGITLCLGHGCLVELQKNRDAYTGRKTLAFAVRIGVQHTGLNNDFAAPLAPLNLSPWCGIDLLPRAVDEHGRVFVEFIDRHPSRKLAQ